jgi:predicted RNA-binding Zn-ribbon protein involved in translation (DUF1610 family)
VVGITYVPIGSSTRWVWVDLPLWTPVALGCGLLVVYRVLRLRDRARPGLCVACGYDRATLPVGAACPECGGVAILPQSNTTR